MLDLASKTCEPCREGTGKLNEEQSRELLKELDRWEVVQNHHLSRRFEFPDFVTALDYVNKIGALAEEQGHHPNLSLTWGEVGVDIWTHKIDGLSEADFILAAKIDRL